MTHFAFIKRFQLLGFWHCTWPCCNFDNISISSHHHNLPHAAASECVYSMCALRYWSKLKSEHLYIKKCMCLCMYVLHMKMCSVELWIFLKPYKWEKYTRHVIFSEHHRGQFQFPYCIIIYIHNCYLGSVLDGARTVTVHIGIRNKIWPELKNKHWH